MKDVLDEIQRWLHEGQAVALATLVSAQGSSPREVGAVMAVSDSEKVAGSISGGCVEAAVVEEASSAIATGKARLLSYGVADELGFSVGLTCGGTIQVFVERLEPQALENNAPLGVVLETIRKAAFAPLAICTVVEGLQAGAKMTVTETGETIGSLGSPELDRLVIRDARGLIERGLRELRHYGDCEWEVEGQSETSPAAVFIESFAAKPHLIVFGAVNFARSLCKLGKILGYYVTICDARSLFATKERFPEADEVVAQWPNEYLESVKIDRRTSVAVLTHDPKFDVPALMTAVRTDAAYIGAMGSRKATADRIERLKEAGISDAELARISSPIGLDIGARTSEETAVSIMAEIIARQNGRSGGRLSLNQNPIHGS